MAGPTRWWNLLRCSETAKAGAAPPHGWRGACYGGLPRVTSVPVVLLFALVAALLWEPPEPLRKSNANAEVEERWLAPAQVIAAILAAPDMSDAYVVTWSGWLQRIDLRTGTVESSSARDYGVHAAGCSADGRVLALAFTDGSVRVERNGTAKSGTTWSLAGERVMSMAVSSTGDFVLAEPRGEPPCVVDAETGRVRCVLTGGAARVLAISPDDALAAVFNNKTHTLRLHSCSDGRLVREMESDAVGSACFSPCGKHLLVGLSSGYVSCRDLPTLAERWRFGGLQRRKNAFGPPSDLAVSSQGVVALDDTFDDFGAGGVLLLDLDTGALLEELPWHEGGIAELSFSEDGRQFLSVTRKGLVRTWDSATLAELSRVQIPGI